MKKKAIVCLLAAVLMVTGGMWNVAFADNLDEQQAEVEAEQEEVSNELSEVSEKVEAAQAEVDAIQSSIEVKEGEISAAASEIEQLKVDMQEREEGLNERLRAMYKNGSVGYLDVLLGSNSISEFLNNIEMIQRIFKNDQDTLKTLEEQHGILEEKQAVLEEEKAALSQQKEKQAAKQAELEESKGELQAQLDALNAEADRISAEIQARQEALAQQQAQNGTSGGGNYSGGVMMWPCDSTYITSEFGYRIHPITGIWTGHTGIDIGCSMYAPIYAAESGTVILAEWYGGYGNAVVIDHGGGITTLYGHNEELYVSVGQKVSRGETIAGAGSTGWSTGPHLHFEVREGGNYVDPMGYL
ncbi:MAG: peptidoglycan DD-metalloendopeptidase family protein [Firmicutes bacterium]|nr:peptidoglycan DD-metalloendopeptidase family protein [Bacillota bacterium]